LKKVEVLGPGCPKCEQLYEATQQAIDKCDDECELRKVSDINEIVSYGIMMTPALVIDGDVKVVSKVPSVEEIVDLLG